MDMQQKSGWKVRINLHNKAKILNLNYLLIYVYIYALLFH